MKCFLCLCLLASLFLPITTEGQESRTFQVTGVVPYDKAVAGQIMELTVAGFQGGAASPILPVEDFRLVISQDGVSQDAKIRTVTSTLRSDFGRNDGTKPVARTDLLKLRPFQSVRFVVPQGLHPGAAELTLSYQGKNGNSIGLTIVRDPLRPVVSTVSVMTMNASSTLPLDTRLQGNDLRWKLERGSMAQVSVNPLVDPDDPKCAILVRFKQGENHYDAQTRVMNEPFRVENRNSDFGVFAARDVLEVDVPAALTMGPAEVEIRVRANGHEGEPTLLRAMITDSARSAEAPTANAPRLLTVAPTRVGAGQSLILSLDNRRSLDPDPESIGIVIEQGGARYSVPVEKSSLKLGPRESDEPVMFFVRTTREIIGKAQIRIFNELRGAMSEPVPIEILEEPLPPELLGVTESIEAELTTLRQIYELHALSGRKFPEFDPQHKYVTIHVKEIDFNPEFVRVTFEQNGKRFALKPEDFSWYSHDKLIVRRPKQLKSGPTKVTVENRGIDSFSIPATGTFEICCTP